MDENTRKCIEILRLRALYAAGVLAGASTRVDSDGVREVMRETSERLADAVHALSDFDKP